MQSHKWYTLYMYVQDTKLCELLVQLISADIYKVTDTSWQDQQDIRQHDLETVMHSLAKQDTNRKNLAGQNASGHETEAGRIRACWT